ncbi:NAPDH-dependent diflavin reductase [Coemansia sp. RSA 989]|nr:NADPH dependent diflavin oxidoreductase 1-like protein [Coemansia mojavensis]KAJ1865355.1 NAPDH-dependent diflavin reductase [Coemansia sp. RSA 989]KAJ1874609.1 NAPDH-dependent diflavin reductase [Coemansia sp. RSA 990]KAJ2671164.1 NAPDH-dependent diflavin reductase [Coemansia sp. RSA 1085]
MAEETEAQRRVLILYGSQTGYAKDTAFRIGRQAWRRHFAATIQALDDTDKWQIFTTQQPVIFVCSTTGQGDEPDNMKRFWRFLLRKSIPPDALHSLQFAVFGLGDSSYAKFNFAAKRLFRRLEQLGAHALLGRGDGDDQHYLGLDGALDPWLDSLWSRLLQKYPLPEPIVPSHIPPPPSCTLAFAHATPQLPQLPAHLLHARLALSERMTSREHFQDVHRFRLLLPEPPVADARWSPGDCAVLRPLNDPGDVERFLELMHWTQDADRPLRITAERATLPPWVPQTTTLRWLFTHYLDITAVPRRSFFEMLYYFSSAENEKERLHDFTVAEGQDELHTYCMKPRRTIMEALGDFPNSRVPLSYIFDVFPEIAERSFSVSSACEETPREVDLTVAIVRYKTIMQKPRVGKCTQWLLGLHEGDSVALRFARGTMRLPALPETPIIMVGPGTGIAAFMSFIRARVRRGISANYLFFGCRSASHDFLYKSQLLDWCNSKMLHLECAFSRDQAQKVYVQHKIRQRSDLIWSLINDRGAVVYVSGNANRMPEDVRQAFVDVVAEHSESPHEYIQAMVKSRRYQEECWY